MMKQKIYLIPGTMCNEKLWAKLFEELDGVYDLEHLAMPFGESIDDIIDTLIVKMISPEINLLGFSFGGYLAAAIATKIPARINSLFIVSNSPCSLSSQELQKREENLGLIEKYGYKGISRKKASALLNSTTVNENALKTILEMDAELGEKCLVNQLAVGSERQDLARELRAINIPVTLIYSEGDCLVNSQWIAEFLLDIPAVNIVTLTGDGHMLPIEKPIELANILRNSPALSPSHK